MPAATIRHRDGQQGQKQRAWWGGKLKNASLQTSETSAGTSAFYIGNPREHRALDVLLQRSEISRHDLDGLIGAENSPDVVMRMRRKFGLDIYMEKRKFTDRDGQQVRIGFYSLSATDRPKVIAALNGRG